MDEINISLFIIALTSILKLCLKFVKIVKKSDCSMCGHRLCRLDIETDNQL